MKHAPNPYRTVASFHYLIIAAQRQGNRIFQDKLKELNLTSSQAEVIMVLQEAQPVTLEKLSHLLVCETESPSHLINHMVKEGWVSSVKNPDVEQDVQVKLTDKGKQLTKPIQEIEEEIYRMLEKVLTKEEMEVTNRVLSKFLLPFPVSNALKNRGYSSY